MNGQQRRHIERYLTEAGLDYDFGYENHDWQVIQVLADAILERRDEELIDELAQSEKLLVFLPPYTNRPLITTTEPAITITYEILTDEDREFGETDNQGWYDEEGVSMIPDEWDLEEDKTVVDLAVQFLWRENAVEPSEGGKDGAPRWWTWSEPERDYWSGADEYRSFHLIGFSRPMRQEVYQLMEQKMRH